MLIKSKKIVVIMAVLAVLVALAGCGKKLEVANWVEYTSLDETYSIEAAEGYEITDMQMDSWLALEAAEGLDSLLVMQFPKSGGFIGGWSSLGEAIEFIEQSNQLSDKKEMTKPESTVLGNIEAYTYKMTQDEYTEEISVVYGETDYAHYMLMYSENKLKRYSDDYFGKVCASLQENTEVVEAKMAATDVSDTIRWFNASNAILIAVNGWDYNLYGGLAADQASQAAAVQILENSWEVTDRETADETLNWLLYEGQRETFAEEMEYIKECGMDQVEEADRVSFMLEYFDVSEEEAENYARWYGLYETGDENATSGWDYNRALSQIANFYLAGYYSQEEALDASLEVAETIQNSFDSWDDYMESYFNGYEYWAEESSEERRGVYEQLKSAADNPYGVDFNLELEKSW